MGIVREVQGGGRVATATVRDVVSQALEPAATVLPAPPLPRTARKPRKSKPDGKASFAPRCSKCGQAGHNARSCKG